MNGGRFVVRAAGLTRRRWRRRNETAERLLAAATQTLAASRFEMKYSVGALPHDKLMRSIELYGTRVIPLVHNLLGA